MEGNRVMNSRTNPGLAQVVLKCFPIPNLHDVEVENSFRPGRLEGEAYPLPGLAEKLLIFRRTFAASFVPGGEMSQLDSQDASLNRIQSTVVTFHIMEVFLGLAVIAKHPDFINDSTVVGRNRARFAAGPQILP